MSRFTAVHDACVLYPAPLRDLLISLAQAGIYRAKWSQQIHEEWTRSLLRNKPEIDPKRIERTCTQMNTAVPDSLVTGYEAIVDSLALADPNDRHVLAVAIRVNADAIITFNLRDFDELELKKYDIYTEHPDEFVSNMITIYTPKVIEVVQEMRKRLKKPPKSVSEFLGTLRDQGPPQSAEMLREFSSSI